MYGSGEKLEEYAYKEVDLADLLISVVGSRFGTRSQHEDRSISQEELKRALERNVQVYVFVERAVLTEYETYRANKGVKGVEWRYVDDVHVYVYLEEIFALRHNNTVQGFETASDITSFLKRQWAGLLHRFLQDQAKARELSTLEGIQATVATLDRVLEFLIAERDGQRLTALTDILSANHPFFARLRFLLGVHYPLFVRTASELNRWLVDAQQFKPVPPEAWDDKEHREWYRANQYLKVSQRLFDEQERLSLTSQEDWDDDYLQLLMIPYMPEIPGTRVGGETDAESQRQRGKKEHRPSPDAHRSKAGSRTPKQR